MRAVATAPGQSAAHFHGALRSGLASAVPQHEWRASLDRPDRIHDRTAGPSAARL